MFIKKSNKSLNKKATPLIIPNPTDTVEDKFGFTYTVEKKPLTIDTFSEEGPTIIKYHIYDTSSGLIGKLILHNCTNTPDVEISYNMTNIDFRNRGIMGKVVGMAIDDVYSGGVFDNQPVIINGESTLSQKNNIFLNIDFTNYPSRNIAEKNGFVMAENGYIFNLSRQQYLDQKASKEQQTSKNQTPPSQ